MSSLRLFRFRSGAISDFRPTNIHARLGEAFFDAVDPADFPQHILRYRNQDWAKNVGLGGLSDEKWVSHFGRFEPFEGSFPRPLALRYHGHQFQSYNPQLGDGRGFLFAQLLDGDDRVLDFGTKGSGQTPWSRQGDGRLTLKGGVREVLATSMLEALGVNTSKTFSLIETGESLTRGDEPSPTRSAVMVRLNHSHIRIGTFQRQAYLKNEDELARLLAHCVEHYMPQCQRETQAETAAAFLEEVARGVAMTGANWTAAGFVHGVLNTDNINITGESFDYGPWRFAPTYDPAFTAAYFDHSGLYAFGRQPDALAWNLTRLAETLVPLSKVELLEPALNSYWHVFHAHLQTAFLRRLGLRSIDETKDSALIEAIIGFMGQSQAPFEQVLFDWRGGKASASRVARSPINSMYTGENFERFEALIGQFEAREDVNLDHPYFARMTPRTMLVDEVEAIWSEIAERDDWSVLDGVLQEIAQMADAYGV